MRYGGCRVLKLHRAPDSLVSQGGALLELATLGGPSERGAGGSQATLYREPNSILSLQCIVRAAVARQVVAPLREISA